MNNVPWPGAKIASLCEAVLPPQHASKVVELIRLAHFSERLELLRFAVAGVGVSLGYTITVVLLVELRGWQSPAAANLLSFLLWTPISYFVHRDFTFRFGGRSRSAALKFFATFIAKLLASVIVVGLATRAFGAHYIFGVLANWVVLPLISYLVLKVWVFR